MQWLRLNLEFRYHTEKITKHALKKARQFQFQQDTVYIWLKK